MFLVCRGLFFSLEGGVHLSGLGCWGVGCLLSPVVSSLSGGVTFFVPGVFSGFSFGGGVGNWVAEIVFNEGV